MTKNILISILISAGLIGGTFYFLSQDSNSISVTRTTGSGENIEIRDGVQYVTISARGGYSPNISEANANMPTKLIVKTDGTYDCSASLVIRDVGFQKILQPTGDEVIDIGIHKPGDILQGLCSMGMYNFSVSFN
jgi:plastocyanin domain-containing protein